MALALVGEPELMFLDEPTTGFDPAARRSAWHMIEGLKALGTTIVLTTHYLEEAEILSDRIAVIDARADRGRGHPRHAGRAGPGADRHHLPPARRDRVAAARLHRRWVRAGSTWAPTTRRRDLHELTQWAVSRGLALEELDVRRPSLEDVYLQLTSENENENENEEVGA